MNIKRFEDLEVWKKSRELNRILFRICFENEKKIPYPIVDQLSRASLSVMCNIAEGFGSGSDKNFVKYLNISLGSIHETQSILYVMLDQRLYDEDTFDTLYSNAEEIKKMLYGLKKYLNAS